MTPAGAPASRAVPGVPEVNTHREKRGKQSKNPFDNTATFMYIFSWACWKMGLVLMQRWRGCWLPGTLRVPPASRSRAPPGYSLDPHHGGVGGLSGLMALVPGGHPTPQLLSSTCCHQGKHRPFDLGFQNPADVHMPLCICRFFCVLRSPVW